jgi:hypothetical protein
MEMEMEMEMEEKRDGDLTSQMRARKLVVFWCYTMYVLRFGIIRHALRRYAL